MVETLPLRGNFFADQEYASTDVTTGVMRNRAGTRLCALTSDFLIGFRNAVVHECADAANLIFRQCGRAFGLKFGAKLDKELREYYGVAPAEMPLAQFYACLVEAFSHHGWGRLTLDYEHQEEGLLLATIENAPYAELVAQAETPSDQMLGGVLAGLFSYFSDQTLDALQTECPSCGGTVSRFVIGLESRLSKAANWVSQGKDQAKIVTDLAKIRA